MINKQITADSAYDNNGSESAVDFIWNGGYDSSGPLLTTYEPNPYKNLEDELSNSLSANL